MDEDSLVTVYTVADANKAEVIRLGLQSEGIPCEIGGDGQAGLTGLGILKIDILVAAKNRDAAVSYLQKHHP